MACASLKARKAAFASERPNSSTWSRSHVSHQSPVWRLAMTHPIRSQHCRGKRCMGGMEEAPLELAKLLVQPPVSVYLPSSRETQRESASKTK